MITEEQRRAALAQSAEYIERLERRGYKRLGSGLYSVVLAMPNSNRVIKVGRGTDDWLDYIMWASRKGYGGTFAPRLYSLRVNIGWYVAVVERLACVIAAHRDDDTPQYRAFRRWSQYLYSGPRWAECTDEDIEAISPGALQFTKDFIEAFPKGRDLHDENWMVRHDGSLVLTDPLSSQSYTGGSKRIRSRDLQAMAA